MKQINTIEELKTYCQEVANLTGCCVTVEGLAESIGRIKIWSESLRREEIYHDSFDSEWLKRYGSINTTYDCCIGGIVHSEIPNPEQMLFTPGGE